MTDQNQGETQFETFMKKKFPFIAAALVAVAIYTSSGHGTPQQPANGSPVAQGPQGQIPQGQVPQGQIPQGQQGPVQGDGSGVPYVDGGDGPYAGPVPDGGGVPAVGPSGAGDGGVDMDEWRRRQVQDDGDQRRRIDGIREEEHCRNSDGTEDTVSIHTGC